MYLYCIIFYSIWGVHFLLTLFVPKFMPERYAAYLKAREEKWKQTQEEIERTGKTKNGCGCGSILLVMLLPFLISFLLLAKILPFPLESRFVCRKETQRCDYYRSGYFIDKLQLSESYSLDGIENVEIDVSTERRGKNNFKVKIYTLIFRGPKNSFSMPQQFETFYDTAKDEADKANNFLHNDTVSEYAHDEKSGDCFSIILLTMLGLFGIWTNITFLFRLFKAGKETQPPLQEEPPDVITKTKQEKDD